MGLREYEKKRNFNKTSEPKPGTRKAEGNLKFVVQRHHASHLHYDFRLELDGVLKSWAVPKGPSLNPKDKRLAMMVEDHPYDYRTFEGIIPEGNYGAGAVTIFDEGTYESITGENEEKELKKGLYAGNLKFRLHGKILKGEFALVKIKDTEDNSWLLIKHRDEYAVEKKFDSEDLVPEEIKKRGIEIKKKAKGKKANVASEEKDEEPSYTPAAIKPRSPSPLPDEKDWVYERKIEGERVLVHTGATLRFISEDRNEIQAKHGKLADALPDIKTDAVIDGVIAPDGGKKERLYVFDLLSLDGHDLRGLELIRRKQLLRALIDNAGNPAAMVYHEHQSGSQKAILKEASENKWPGVIAKKASSLYDSNASDTWIELTAEDKKSPSQVSAKKNTEKRKMAAKDDLEENFGRKKVKLTHLSKLYWKKENITKGDLIEYYRSISDYILPYLKDRPLSLNRHPNGIDAPGFFQKDLDVDQIPSWIKYAPLYSESNNKDIDYLICNDLPTLLWMVNLGCIEINPWLSTWKKPENPVFAVMDLDPNDVDDFGEVVKVALTTKEILEQMGVRPYIKTSGSRGLHIFMHLGGKYDYDIVKDFVHYLGQMINAQHPDITSLERSPSKRKKKIYLDFLQNRRGQTIAAPYSARPKPGATVSTPLEWDEVNEDLDIKKYTIFNTQERLSEKGDLWKEITAEKADLRAALKNLQ